jgi:hypothetical protein
MMGEGAGCRPLQSGRLAGLKPGKTLSHPGLFADFLKIFLQ